MSIKSAPIASPTGVVTNARTVTQTFNTSPKGNNQALKDKITAAQSAPPQPQSNITQQKTTETAQPTNTEAQTAAPSEAPAQPASPQLPDAQVQKAFADLARKERQLRKDQQELKAAHEDWKRRETEFISRKTLQDSPLQALADAGISYDKLVELQLNQIAPDPNAQLMDKIASLEDRLAKLGDRDAQRDIDARKQVVDVIRNDAKLLVESDPAYETIKATNSVPDVVDYIEKVFDSEGVILTVEEAAKDIEEELVLQKTEQIKKLSQLSKIKSKLAPPVEATQEVAQKPSSAKTLTNAHGVARPLSARERAIQAFERTKLKL